ncbi:RiPP maturation radical SAM protein 1 [Nonomuraea sp. FMUSA5-5]|uniref:RiPP maturation radical SAM protein 1 n=1 Tax=Nonomuraea composti TaxID=2720023 RepID=A0ABX1B0S6_9ACTN|nr:RiPP maturation radical SAM protein 1 [Nonomuraea sp. FMUSA5-5]
MDVCLVSMPYAGLPRPSMGLSLLKGILIAEGIETVVANANLWFAESVGLELYHLCANHAPTEFLMGEWTFAGVAFPEAEYPGARDGDEQYLAQIADSCGRFFGAYGRDGGDRLVADLVSLREMATKFVDEAARRVLASGARVVGCTSTFEQHAASLALLRRVRELDPAVITMMGGANCETVMGEATHRCFPWVDYVVSGEADGLITGLCRLVLAQGRDVPPEQLPPGVLGPRSREGGGAGFRARGPGVLGLHGHRPRGKALPRALFRDLDSLPVPEFDDYFAEVAASPLRPNIRPGLPLETSRGCWWGDVHQCTFCGLNGSSMAFRSKSPERVLAEVRELERRHGISDFEVVDNILDMAYFRTVLPRLAADDRPRRLFYEVKANLTRKQVELLVRAGVTWVQPGIESLHSEVLALMDKGVRGWQNVQLLKWARELGLRLSWSLLWGFPGEHDHYYRTMAGWLPLLEHLQAPNGLSRLRYDRYSVYHQRAGQLGLTLTPISAMAHVYPLDRADLDDLTYFFTAEPESDTLDLAAFSRADVRERPGTVAVYEAVREWRAAFRRHLPPILSLVDRDGVLDIMDSRGCARRWRTTLSGLARAVYLAADAAPRADRIADAVNRDLDVRASEDEVRAVVDELVADRLVLPIDGRLVALAVKGDLPALPQHTEFPGGHVSADPS